MDRSEWLKQMRLKAEALYDHISPLYWKTYGLYENKEHLAHLQKFLEMVPPGEAVLSAGCGAGRYDGYLLEAGHPVTGIDQSTGMLDLARQHFPQVRYAKIGLQEITFRQEFAGVICIDALEHVCPEDYPVILQKFSQALKPGGVLYFTVDTETAETLEASYQRSRSLGLPVLYGEKVDQVEEAFDQVKAMDQSQPAPQADEAVYHYYPSLDQVRRWLDQAGMDIWQEGDGGEYHHFIARKRAG